jgi:hypothetical protein
LGGKTYTVQYVLAYDKDIDIAVLQINAQNLTAATVCESTHKVGETVYAFGSSQGLTATFSQGIITYANRATEGVYYTQHDAAISSGNSGGPLINQYGEVIGINTLTLRDSQNLNFAINISHMSDLSYGTKLTVAQFYEKECDVLSKIKNYIMQNGTYDAADGEYLLITGSDYMDDIQINRMLYYNVVEDTVMLCVMLDTDYMVQITIDVVDGEYEWWYIDYADNFMSGTIYASTYTSNTLLGYSYHNMTNSSLCQSVRKLSSTMIDVMLKLLELDLAEIGVTARDLGFYNY